MATNRSFVSEEGLTVQVSLCAGDAPYAPMIVPRLFHAHPNAAERLLIVDTTRPPKARFYDPEEKAPLKLFQPRVSEVIDLANELMARHVVDRVEFLMPADKRFRELATRFVLPWMRITHDAGGCAYMAYWAAYDFPRHRYVLHYDADILLFQRPGYDWSMDAVGLLQANPNTIDATCRTAPPGFELQAPSLDEGCPWTAISWGFLNDWFSSRCFLVDRSRLWEHLPLLPWWRTPEFLLRRLIDVGYPPRTENLLSQVVGSKGGRRIHLASNDAWFVHPTSKPDRFVTILPDLLEAIDAGELIPEQIGRTELRLEGWMEYLGGR